ncbi:MAG: hypothetical protein Fur0016_22750 [Anaerolineales bacterium]
MKRNVAILLALLLLAGLPPLGFGYFNRYQAETLRQKFPAQASRQYETAANLLFWQPGLRERAGLTAFEGGEMQRALSLLLNAQERDSLSPEGLLALGEIYAHIGDFDSAYAQAWRPLSQAGFASPALFTRLAQYAAHQQDFPLEASSLTRLLELAPQNAPARYRLALLQAVDNPQTALVTLQQARDPASHLLRQSLEQALLQEDPAYRHILIGRALANLNEWSLALNGFRAAARENPQYAEAWAWQAEALYQLGAETSRVEQDYQTALTLNPNSAGIQAMAGLYRERKRDYPQAEAYYLRAVQLEPRNPAWRLALAAVVARRDLPAALAHYQAATQLAPDDPSTWLALATFSVEYQAFLEEAGLEAALRAYALEPENPTVLDLLGRALAASGQIETAQIIYERAIALAPNQPAPHFHLALLYLQTNQHAQARQALENTTHLDPNGPYARQAQEILARYFP